MMRHLLFLTVFLALFYHTSAQDIIITTEGDTIDCKITRITDEYVHFSVFGKGGVLLMTSRLPLSKIRSYTQAEINEDNQPAEIPELKREDRIVLDEFAPANVRLSVTTGYTYQLGGYDGLPDSYKRQLQSLWNIGSDIHYFVSDEIGIGAKYNHIRTKANEDFEPPYSTAFGFSALRDERVRFSYIGLSLLYRNFYYDDQVVNYFISGGMVRYRTDGFGDGVPFYQEGDTFAMVLGVSYDFLLVENFGIGMGAEVNIARLTEMDNNGAKAQTNFSLTRLDFTVGIRLFQ